MKKLKILTVFGVLLAMGITACNKGGESEGGDAQSQEAPVSQPASQPAGESTEHKHSYGEWHETKAPTCTEKGEEQRECACGDVQKRDVKAKGHTWGEWSVKTAATCTADGVEERNCQVAGCDGHEERAIKAGHDWDAEETVPAGTDPENQVSYKLAVCKKGDAIKADIRAVDAKFYKGGIKQSSTNPTPDGYFKLGSKNDKAYWRFTVAGTKMYKGMLYQRGAMDSFSGNTDRTYAMTSTSGDHAPSYPLGNFDVKVNGDSLDKSQWIDIPFSELLAEGDDSSAMGDNFSPLALAPIGECVIQPGANEITYERLGSYNLLISDLIFIGSEFEHVHAPATTWSSDENGHWHACTAIGCPTNGKADAVVAHTFEEVTAESVAATCSKEGKKVEKCSVCDFKKETVLPKLAHTLGAAYDVVEATCAAEGSQKKKCSVCDEVVTEVLPKLAHSYGDAVENYAAVTEGENQHVAATAHNCSSVCNTSALRWSATAYDAAKTTARSTCEPESRANGSAVRFGAPKDSSNKTIDGCENYNQDETLRGTHLVYNVNVPADATNVGLAFKTAKRTDAQLPPVFDKAEGDSSKGYEKVNGEWVRPDSRYGLKVDGQRVVIEKDTSGQTWLDGVQWYYFPVTIESLSAGVHEIEVYAYGGYRADIYEFELTGLPHVTPSHVHNGADSWQSDNDNHWHVCTGEGCPIADGIYDKAAHDWNDVVQVTAPTCTATGAGTKECKVCHKVVDVVIPALGHNISAGTAVKNSDDKDVAPITCSRGDVEGYQMALADYTGTANAIASDGKLAKSAEMTWKFKLTADGEGHYKTGKVAFVMCARLNGGTAFGATAPADNAFADDYSIKVGEKAGTVTCAGKQLGVDFGATVDNAVYFEFGTIEFEESDLVNGELVITIKEAANQGYRHRYQDNVRIMYVA